MSTYRDDPKYLTLAYRGAPERQVVINTRTILSVSLPWTSDDPRYWVSFDRGNQRESGWTTAEHLLAVGITPPRFTDPAPEAKETKRRRRIPPGWRELAPGVKVSC